jgi:hypothetical protein
MNVNEHGTSADGFNRSKVAAEVISCQKYLVVRFDLQTSQRKFHGDCAAAAEKYETDAVHFLQLFDEPFVVWTVVASPTAVRPRRIESRPYFSILHRPCGRRNAKSRFTSVNRELHEREVLKGCISRPYWACPSRAMTDS